VTIASIPLAAVLVSGLVGVQGLRFRVQARQPLCFHPPCPSALFTEIH
jgi:hypothetical protein